MDPITLKSQWTQWLPLLAQRFPRLEADDLIAIDGEFRELADALQRRYGWDRAQAEAELAAAVDAVAPDGVPAPMTERARAALGPGTAKVREGLAEIGAGLRALAGDAAHQVGDTARERGEQVAQVAAEAQARAGDALAEAGDAAQRVLAGTGKFVRERPFTAVGIAFLAGWILFGRR